MGLISVAVIIVVACVLACLAWQARRKRQSEPTGNKWQYCPWCRSDLEPGVFEGKTRMKCTRCRFVHWDNPRPVSVVLIPTADGGVVLVKRKLPPRAGMFALPGGFVEPHETPEAGAVREAREETGIDIEIDRLLWMVVPPGVNEILFFYLARPTSAQPAPGSDAAEATVFARADIPAEVAFQTHRQVLDQWLRAAA